MASHARLAAPKPEPQREWPWHAAKTGSVSAATLLGGDRRLEAQTYLSSGFGIRTAIEHRQRWKRFAEFATAWMPGRLKGIQVAREFGTSFLAATQVYDLRPITRKWLALERTADAQNRFVKQGTILVTCSGSVGRATMACALHEDILISHDLLRIRPIDDRNAGWIYAYLHSSQFQAMAVGSHYGHIIKHIEPSHIESLPVPTVDRKIADRFLESFNRVIHLRNAAQKLSLDAEAAFADALGQLDADDRGESGFVMRASSIFSDARLRMDASVHNPLAVAIRQHQKARGHGFTTIANAGYDVWLPTRFRRIPADNGVPLVESGALVQVNPDITKRIADIDFGDKYQGRVRDGWLLVSRSGQVYGILGTTVIAGPALAGHVVSDDVIRMAPTASCSMRPGYLLVALSHPTLGLPVVKSLAYGSSIPHIEPTDIAALPVVRLKPAQEIAIANMAEQASESRYEADSLERSMGAEATEIIAEFIAGKVRRGTDRDTNELVRHILDTIAPDA